MNGQGIESRSSQAVISVAVVEDNDEYRDLLQQFLEIHPGLELTLAAISMEDYLWESRNLPAPQVVLMDVELPGMNGITGIGMVKDRAPNIKVVMLTVCEDWDRIFAALKGGAAGYLLKSTPLDRIYDQLALLNRGGAPMSPEIAHHIVRYFNQPVTQVASPLTPREKEVVAAIMDGLSYKEIADRLCISVGTVYSHIKKIYKKLEVHSKVELINKKQRGEF